jgi:tRNA(Ile)-lysidine synthase
VALHALGHPIALAHAQYGLRGDDSVADEQGVRQLAKSLSCAVLVQDMRTGLEEADNGESLQMQARKLRRAWLQSARKQGMFHAIATAHHADDQAETVLMRFLAGSGVEGLAGIRLRHEGFIRPLLHCRKTTLQAWAEARGLTWREDRSNAEPTYWRNQLRLEFLPHLEAQRPGTKAVLAGAAERFAQSASLLQRGREKALRRLLQRQGNQERLAFRGLAKEPAAEALLAHWLRPKGFQPDQCRDMVNAAQKQTGVHWDGQGYRVYRERRHLVLLPLSPTYRQDQADRICTLPPIPTTVRHAGKQFRFSTVTKSHLKMPRGYRAVLLDADKLKEPLILRPWQAGDYFHPAPGGKKRKVKRYLTDAKMPASEKEGALVLCSGAHLVWLPGWGVDRRFLAKDNRPAIKAEMLSIPSADSVDQAH